MKLRRLRSIVVATICSLGLVLLSDATPATPDEIPPVQHSDAGGTPKNSADPDITFKRDAIQSDEPKADAEKPKAPEEDGSATRYVDLLTEDLTTHWKQFNSVPASENAPVWKIVRGEDNKELILVCSGEPKGYLHTTEPYADFEMTLEWKYPKDTDGNSGVLIYTQVEPRIWPTSMQVQLHQPKAGSVFPSGDALSDQSSENETELARPVNTWNECRIVSRGGRLAVEVNGRKAGEVSGAKPFTGRIALQSEGSVVHFRRIRILKLSSAESKKIEESLPPGPGTTQNPAIPPTSAPNS